MWPVPRMPVITLHSEVDIQKPHLGTTEPPFGGLSSHPNPTSVSLLQGHKAQLKGMQILTFLTGQEGTRECPSHKALLTSEVTPHSRTCFCCWVGWHHWGSLNSTGSAAAGHTDQLPCLEGIHWHWLECVGMLQNVLYLSCPSLSWRDLTDWMHVTQNKLNY